MRSNKDPTQPKIFFLKSQCKYGSSYNSFCLIAALQDLVPIQAAVTESHRLVVTNNRSVSLPVLESGHLRSGGQLVSKGLFQVAVFSLRPYRVEGTRSFLCLFL